MLNCSSFSAKSPAAPALLACKRARNAPACYQLFAGSSLFQNFLPTSFLFTSLHVGARSALLRLIFLPVASKYAIRHPLSPPFRKNSRSIHPLGLKRSRDGFAVAPDLSRVRIYFKTFRKHLFGNLFTE